MKNKVAKIGKQVKDLMWANSSTLMSSFSTTVANVAGLVNTTTWANYVIGTPTLNSPGIIAVAGSAGLDDSRINSRILIKSLDLRLNLFNGYQATVNTAGSPTIDVRIVLLSCKGIRGGVPTNAGLALPTLSPLFQFQAAAGLAAGEFFQQLAMDRQAKSLYKIHYDKVVSLSFPYTSAAIPGGGQLAAATATISNYGPVVHNIHFRKKMNHKVTYVSNLTGEAVPCDGELFLLAFSNVAGATNAPGIEGAITLQYEI